MLCLSVVHYVPKIQYDGAKSNRKYTSRLLSVVAHISRVPGHIVTKIPTAVPMFSRSSSSMVLSTMSSEVALYTGNRYGGCTNRNLPNINPHEYKKYISNGYSFENGNSTCLHKPLVLLDGSHIYFRYNATSGDIVDNTIEQHDLENVGILLEFCP